MQFILRLRRYAGVYNPHRDSIVYSVMYNIALNSDQAAADGNELASIYNVVINSPCL